MSPLLDLAPPRPQDPLLLTPTAERLWQTLQDIAHHVELDDQFCIRHPHYQIFELPPEAIARFQKLPTEIQDRYRRLQLCRFLYGVYYNGSIQGDLAADAPQQEQPLNLENNTVLGVDVGFYQRLHDANQGTGYFDPDWSVLKLETDEPLVVTKGGLRLHVERDLHVHPTEHQAAVGDRVAIRMPKNRVQNGFYMAVGNRGAYHSSDADQLPHTVRIYFNVTSTGAIALMEAITQSFNQAAIPFSFKVLYNPADYQRYDAGVLYFDQQDYSIVQPLLNQIYGALRSNFQPQIPLFTKPLAVGLGLAEEPNQKFGAQESFGMNRCQMIADGLLAAWNQAQTRPEHRMQAILYQFSQLGIDWQRAYLNAQSEDIYIPLSTSNQTHAELENF